MQLDMLRAAVLLWSCFVFVIKMRNEMQTLFVFAYN